MTHNELWNNKQFIMKRMIEQCHYRDQLLERYFDNRIDGERYMELYSSQDVVTQRLNEQYGILTENKN